MLDHALAYARQGWPVFPVHAITPAGHCACRKGPQCQDVGKHPHVRWRDEATTDERQIREWWSKWPCDGIGLPTGTASGLYVVDLDCKPGEPDGIASWAAIDQDGPLPLIARTGSGGLHLFYMQPGREYRSSAKRLGPGIDTRGEGGYVLLAPSSHRSGGRYEWLQGEGEAPAVPSWLLERLPLGSDLAAVLVSAEALRAHVVPANQRRPLTAQDVAQVAATLLTARSQDVFDAARDMIAVIDGRAWGDGLGTRDPRLSNVCYWLVLHCPWLDPVGSAALFARSCAAVEAEDYPKCGRGTDPSWVAEKFAQKIRPIAQKLAEREVYEELLAEMQPPASYRDALADAKVIAESDVPAIRTLLGGEYARLLALGEEGWWGEKERAEEDEERAHSAAEIARMRAQLDRPRRGLE